MAQILVVDDDATIRELAIEALGRRGLICHEAENGRAALQLCDRYFYDAVLTDVLMPEVHGHQLVTTLRKYHPGSTLFVCTGVEEPRLRRDLLSRGVMQVFSKPLDFDELAATLDAALTGATHETPGVSGTRGGTFEAVEAELRDLSIQWAERLDPLFANLEETLEPPPAIWDAVTRFAQEEASEHYSGATDGSAHTPLPDPTGQRADVRLRYDGSAIAIPCDLNFKPTGDLFSIVMRDISGGGMRLLNTRSVSTQYLALQWNSVSIASMQIRLLLKVSWCKPRGTFYDLGGPFVRQ